MESLIKHVERIDREISKIRNQKLKPANENRPLGLMTAEDKRKLDGSAGARLPIEQVTDVSKLAPGHYGTSAKFLTGTPIPDQELKDDGAYVSIDVSEINDKMKQFVFTESVTGQVWYFNTHSSVGTKPAVWQSVEKFAPLWKGGVQDVGTKITLVDSLNNYSSLEIGITTLKNIQYKKVGVTDEITVRGDNLPEDDKELWTADYELVFTKTDDRTLVIKTNRGIKRGTNGAAVADTNKVVVSTIRGVR